MRRTMRQIERELMKLEAELGTAAEAQYLDRIGKCIFLCDEHSALRAGFSTTVP